MAFYRVVLFCSGRVIFSMESNPNIGAAAGPESVPNMKPNEKQHSLGDRRTSGSPEFFSDRVRSLLRATKAELERTRGRQLSYEELGWYAQQAGSTAFDKL